MELLIDIGNSSVNWAVQEQGRFNSTGVFSYTKNNFEKDIKENFSFDETPARVLVSNVAGDEVFNSLNDFSKMNWQQTCWLPSVSSQYKELQNSYSDTNQMGIDRWLAMIAAWETYHTSLCVVSCGTAITIDLIDADGKHLGGYIIPGIELMQKALINNTVQINVDVNSKPMIDYAKDTQTAVNNGTFLATVSMIDHVVNEFSGESKAQVKCIISGGMADSISSLLKYTFEYEPHLVLKGLSLLHKDKQ